MLEPTAALEDATRRFVGASPALTRAEADADRTARTRRDASSCILLAVVTSPALSADLIDRAIELTSNVDVGAAGQRVAALTR
ncbi:hypothetical protein EAH79_11995 [Sphingomonas koreensis]|jgi:hypothetical protein|nr:hypothetical protein EAH79_11995 [Sphingomonas koreensis]